MGCNYLTNEKNIELYRSQLPKDTPKDNTRNTQSENISQIISVNNFKALKIENILSIHLKNNFEMIHCVNLFRIKYKDISKKLDNTHQINPNYNPNNLNNHQKSLIVPKYDLEIIKDKNK